MENNTRQERLNAAVRYLVGIDNINGKNIVSDVSERVGRHPNNIRAAFRGEDRYLTLKFVNSFCAVYGNVISADWIWTGRGTMLADGSVPYTDNDSNDAKRPRIPTVAMAGNLSEYVNGVKKFDCDLLPIIHQMPSYDFTMIIKGDSMEPKYEGGDEIACREVFDYIEWGKTYVVSTRDGALLKRLYDAGDKIRCVSYNHDEYPDFFIEKSSDLRFYKIVGLIRTNL